MKMRRFCRVFALIAVLSVLSVPFPLSASDSGQSSPKVSGRLAWRIEMKRQQPDIFLQAAQGIPQSGLNFFMEVGPTDRAFEKVFLRLKNEPDDAQINALSARGIRIYPQSWIPPVGIFSSGLVLADLPVNSLEQAAALDFVLYLDTAETVCMPQNDQARAGMNIEQVWNSGSTGAGVTVAVLDSGIQVSQADLPVIDSTNSRDYSQYPVLDYSIANQVTGHGTHVAGTLLGRGVYNPAYKGMAPQAGLVFFEGWE